jgi:uncharacterized protein involved in exopolysaccharide biosynthesis
MSREPSVWRFDPARAARLLWARRRWLLRGHLAVGALAAAVMLLLPRWYASSVALVPAPRDGLALDLTGTAGLMSASGLGLGLQPTPQDHLRMVLKSRAVSDSLVDAFDLRARWGLRRREQARERLAEHTTITTPRDGQVVVEVEARDPALARDLAAAYARFAAREGIRLKSSLAAQRRVYLESRLAELERELGLASERLQRFEETNRALSLPDQARQAVDAYGTLRSQMVLLETELAAARRYFTEQSPEVVSLRDRIAELERQLRRMAHEGGAFLPKGEDLPALRQRYLELVREQASLVAVGEVLRRVYEQARVEEANPVPTFSILDAAELPERHSRPRRGLTVALALALAAAGSVAWVLWRDGRSAGAPAGEPAAWGRRAA